MFLFKASGATYGKVVEQSVHAFPYSPLDVQGDEFVLLSKNKDDCALLERQIQFVAKLIEVRRATEGELERFFPGVNAASRFEYVAELYWLRRLPKPFNLTGALGPRARRYDTVQDFAKLDHDDDLAILRHLLKTNPDVILDVVNNAERPPTDA